jgi:poly(3-hydroxybutyrate) depolymerase
MDRFSMSANTSVEAERKFTGHARLPRLLGLLALLAWSLSAQAATGPRKAAIEFEGLKRSYYLYVPESVSPSKAAPLLLLLHGSGQNGLAILREWTGLAAAQGIVLVAPNSHDPWYWRLEDDSPRFLRDVIEAADSELTIDRRRVYLFGLSGGAVYALTLSVLESQFFAASAVFAGAWRDEESLAIVPHARRKIPVSIFIGDRDEYFPSRWVEATVAALEGSGHPVSLTILERRGHSYAGVARIVNHDAWNFLAGVRLESEPDFESYGQ